MPSSDPNCPFCEIVEGDDPEARVIFRGKHVVAFFPTEPAVLGHTMVVPRLHVESIWDVDPELAARLGVATVSVAAAVRAAMQPHGMNIIQSNGAAATQTVMHVHVHVVPRWDGDAVGRIWPPETSFSEWQKATAWQTISEACGGVTDTLR